MSYTTREVFTPTKPARIAFIERNEINDKLVNALTTPGKQVVVYGHSGTGKTTLLLNKLHQLYETHITSRCMKGLKFDQIILDAFDQLAPFYTSEISKKSTSTRSVELSSSYALINSKISAISSQEHNQKQVRLLPPQLTPQALGKFLGAAKACWILEDFHKIDESEKQSLSQLMKVFMDLSDEYPELKIVAIGAVDTARQVIEYDHEMRHRVAEIPVTLMTNEEIKEIIDLDRIETSSVQEIFFPWHRSRQPVRLARRAAREVAQRTSTSSLLASRSAAKTNGFAQKIAKGQKGGGRR